VQASRLARDERGVLRWRGGADPIEGGEEIVVTDAGTRFRFGRRWF